MNIGGWDRFKSTRNISVKLAQHAIDRTINSPSIWDESDGFKLIHEILKRGINDVVQSRLNQPFDNPETVPIVLFSETSTFMRISTNVRRAERSRDACQVLQRYGSTGSKSSRTGPVPLRGKQLIGWSLELTETRMNWQFEQMPSARAQKWHCSES